MAKEAAKDQRKLTRNPQELLTNVPFSRLIPRLLPSFLLHTVQKTRLCINYY